MKANALPGCRSRSWQYPGRLLIARLLTPGLAAACAARDTPLADRASRQVASTGEMRMSGRESGLYSAGSVVYGVGICA
jgi:hypothetical protein